MSSEQFYLAMAIFALALCFITAGLNSWLVRALKDCNEDWRAAIREAETAMDIAGQFQTLARKHQERYEALRSAVERSGGIVRELSELPTDQKARLN